MKFTEYRRSLKLKKIKKCLIPLENIQCQYNPDYENAWKMVTDGTYSIKSSPHYQFLEGYEDAYIRMHKLYGKKDLWIVNKVNKFRGLLESIRNDRIKELPIILDKPIKKNCYNSGFEIYEGHHRLAIAVFLGDSPEVQICRIG